MKYLAAIFFILLQVGCNPAKQLTRKNAQYQQIVDEYNKNHPQRIDTAAKFSSPPDSSKFYQAIADSIKQVKQKTSITYADRYHDTCTSAKLLYEEGFHLGYSLGFSSGMIGRIHDTVTNTIWPTGLINDIKRQNTQLLADKNAITLTSVKKDSWKYRFIISVILGSIILLLLLIKLFYK